MQKSEVIYGVTL